MASVFLSHSSTDKPFVRKLARSLATRGHTVWLDEIELQPGDSLVQRISEALEKADFVAAVISPASIKSRWVKKELQLAATKELRDNRTIILPILIGRCEAPEYLRDKLYVDLRDARQYRSRLKLLMRRLDNDQYQTRVRSRESVRLEVKVTLARLLEPAHSLSLNNQKELRVSALCGCFYCLAIFPPSEINSWITFGESTAICPNCGIDSVIASESSVPISKAFLKAMHKRYF
ncbi:MAG: toll/interleukin-1 receptor domain-containing protein [Acidobacteriota bacterium]